MFADIEECVTKTLQSKGLNVREIKRQTTETRLVNPAIFVMVNSGKYSKKGQKAFRIETEIIITIIFKHLRDEKSRRDGAFPILKGIFLALALQDLDLEIQPLMPETFNDITTTQDFDVLKQTVFRMTFNTFFYLEKAEEDTADELIRLGLKYFLQDPIDDAVEDAADNITLT